MKKSMTVAVGLDVHARSIRRAAVRADELVEERTLPYDVVVLEPISVPSPECEAARDLIRARGDARLDRMRDRHRLSKFCLRHGRRLPGASWGVARRIARRPRRVGPPETFEDMAGPRP